MNNLNTKAEELIAELSREIDEGVFFETLDNAIHILRIPDNDEDIFELLEDEIINEDEYYFYINNKNMAREVMLTYGGPTIWIDLISYTLHYHQGNSETVLSCREIAHEAQSLLDY